MRLHLTRLVLKRSQAQGSFVGDYCPVCQEERRVGVIGVYCTKHRDRKLIRYLSCNNCGWKPNPNKWVEVDPNFASDLQGQQRFDFDSTQDSPPA